MTHHDHHITVGQSTTGTDGNTNAHTGRSSSPSDDPRSSSFFSNPYTSLNRLNRPSQLSPLPRTHRTNDSSSSSRSSDTAYDEKIDVTSPLLPPPGGGREYPFKHTSTSTSSGGVMASMRRARLAMASMVDGRRVSNGLIKRVAVLLGLVVVALMVFGRSATREGTQFIVNKVKPSSTHPQQPSEPHSHASAPWFLPHRHPSPPTDHGLREIDISSRALPLDATLEERLHAWEISPGGRGPGLHPSLVDGQLVEEVELGGFNVWNTETCGSNIEQQLNTHMVQKSANVWGSMNRSTIHDTRMRLIEYMRRHADETVYRVPKELEGTDGGRGIVMVAGNADTLKRVIWSVRLQRDRGSTLPVQVYHFPDERPADDDPLRKELEELGVQLVEAEGEKKDDGKSKSYHLKAIAIVQSPWREVLYLDSDSIPARDPEYMFEAPSYKRLGLWATPDYWKTSGNNAIWAVLGVRCRNEWEMETGQMFIDKGRHLDVFILIRFMLEHHDYFFYYSDGDKDIFRWAMLALRKRWGVPGRWVGAAALPHGTASGEFCSHTMLQHDAWGQPLFVHYNLLKQIPSGVGRGFSWGRTKQMPLFNVSPPPESQGIDGDRRDVTANEHGMSGIGDVDCDMLADADDMGVARSPARIEVRRRAARERGLKARYHGGWISALCIDLEYHDPRPEPVRKVDEAIRKEEQRAREAMEEARRQRKEKADKLWEEEVKVAKEAGLPEPERPEGFGGYFANDQEPVDDWPRRNWDASPLEVVQWGDDERLAKFENDVYDLGFVPSGPGF